MLRRRRLDGDFSAHAPDFLVKVKHLPDFPGVGSSGLVSGGFWVGPAGCDLWTCGQLDHRQEQACQVGDSGCGQESGMTSTVDVT